MTLEQLVVWIIIGGVAGLLADLVVKGIGLSLVEAVLVGIVGAFVGGWVLSALGIFPPGNIVGTIVTAFIGAVLLLLLIGLVRRR
jgi:uncharacterized membrane protein YeaQ/YmgE (transglycosylase-associated protein family)